MKIGAALHSASSNTLIRFRVGMLLTVFIWLTLPQNGTSQDSTGFAFGGYMRSGFGIDGQGGPHDVFQAPNAESKYRLGNEAEAYIEALFSYAFKDERDARFETNLRLAFVTPTSKSNEFTTATSVREAFVRARGIIQTQPAMTFWAGQRFYDRYDVHMNDYFYRDMSGFGGGFEDLRIGNIANLSFAFLGGSIDELTSSGGVLPENEFVLNKTTIDLSLYDVDVQFGKIGFNLAVSNFNGDSIQTSEGIYSVASNTGWSAGVFHELSFAGGRNLLNLFYGTGAAESYKAVIRQPLGIEAIPGVPIDVDGFRRLRVLNDLQIDLSPSFSLLGLILFQQLRNSQPSLNRLDWISAGIRPVYHLGRYFSLAGELGIDYTNQEGGEQGTLLKWTIAPQITPMNKILSRPALRAYFTYARWSDDFVGKVAAGSFAGQNHGISMGLQMEVWW